MSETNDLIMAALLRIEGTVARADAKIDALDSKMDGHIEDDKETKKDVQTLINAKWWLIGLSAAPTVAVAAHWFLGH